MQRLVTLAFRRSVQILLITYIFSHKPARGFSENIQLRAMRTF